MTLIDLAKSVLVKDVNCRMAGLDDEEGGGVTSMASSAMRIDLEQMGCVFQRIFGSKEDEEALLFEQQQQQQHSSLVPTPSSAAMEEKKAKEKEDDGSEDSHHLVDDTINRKKKKRGKSSRAIEGMPLYI